MSTPLEDYALIGDCETAALVSRAGSIDWLCWPRFDSPACFAALLGGPDNGRWLIEAADPEARLTRRYRGNTLILETRIETAEGTAVLIDFMPPRGRNSDIVRLVRGERGRVRMRMELVLRFDYGRTVPWVTRMDDGALRAIAGPDLVTLHTPAPIRGEDLKTVAEFEVASGETMPFVLTHGSSHVAPPDAIDPEAALKATEEFWTEWASRNKSHGGWDEAVMRSLITLKALTYAPTGGLVAAPTTSLPEQLGGTRNWDYRYCWLRDATLTLLAMMNAGYYDEARDWRDWLLRAAAGAPAQLQIMYGLAGERRLPEIEIPWLPGYENSDAGARRQRRARSTAARRLRRGDGRHASGAARRSGRERSGLGLSVRGAQTPRIDLAATRSRPLGGARRAAPLHVFKGHGLGGLRSRHPRHRAVRSVGTGRSLAPDPSGDSRRGL